MAIEDQRHLPPLRLPVITDQEQFPDEFSDVLDIEVLGYREAERILDGARRRILRPIWTLVPKDQNPKQLPLDLRFPEAEPELDLFGVRGWGMWGAVPDKNASRALEIYCQRWVSRVSEHDRG